MSAPALPNLYDHVASDELPPGYYDDEDEANAVAAAIYQRINNAAGIVNNANANAANVNVDAANNANAANANNGNNEAESNVVANADEHGDEQQADSAPSLQQYIEDDSKVAPEKRMTYVFMLSYQNVADFNPQINIPYSDFVNRPGYKRFFKYSKAMIIQELKRRTPTTRPNSNNNSVEQLMAKLVPLDNETDKQYIIAKEGEYRETMIGQRREEMEEAENNAPSARITPDDRLRFACLFDDEYIFESYMRSQNCLTRSELDAGRSGAGTEFREMAVEKLNDEEWAPRLAATPSLHPDFAQPRTLVKGDYVWTTDKVKTFLNDVRRNLTSMIERYERSGNGSNQAALDGDTEEGGDADANWGRVRQVFIAAEGEATIDGDDRANFLQHLPVEYLYLWDTFDKHNLLRFTCARLSQANSASSHRTPQSTSSRTRARSNQASNEQQIQHRQQQMVDTLRNMGRSIAEANAEMGRATKMRCIYDLRAQRYRIALASAAAPAGSPEEAVHERYGEELTQQITIMESDLYGNNREGAGSSASNATNNNSAANN